MATLERAIEIAASAHAGQFDKAGAPYILHPIRVMLRMNTTDEMIVAALHDVVEDSSWTVDDLLAEGFSKEIVEAVGVLAKLPDEKSTRRSSTNTTASDRASCEACGQCGEHVPDSNCEPYAEGLFTAAGIREGSGDPDGRGGQLAACRSSSFGHTGAPGPMRRSGHELIWVKNAGRLTPRA